MNKKENKKTIRENDGVWADHATQRLEQIRIEKETTERRNKEIRVSLLPNLLEFTRANLTELNNYELPLYHSEKACWVSLKAIDYYQNLYLNMKGFKTRSDYLFFDLLIFAWDQTGLARELNDNQTNLPRLTTRTETSEEKQWIEEIKTQLLTLLDAWKDNSEGQQKEELKQTIKILADQDISHQQQYQTLQKTLQQYTSSDQRINDWIERWKEVEEQLVIVVQPWEEWKNISPYFSERLVKEWQNQGFSYEQTKEWISVGLDLNRDAARFCAWARKNNLTPEYVLNEGNFNEISQQYQNDVLLSASMPLSEKQFNWNQFLEEYSLYPAWEEYLELVKERQNEELEKRAKFLANQQIINQGRVSSSSANIEALEEKYDRLAGILRDYISGNQSEQQTSTSQPSTSQEQPQSQTSTSSSRYDDLLSNLSTEEAERQRKKLQRHEAKKKLDEAERKRREDALSEKDRKLKEDEERRQKEKELESQEAERKKKAQEVREQELRENRQSYLDNQATRIEDAKKRAEEALENERKKMELEKQRREAEIEELKKDTEKELQRIEQEKQLFEKEKEEKLKAIDAEDKEARQRIEKEFEEVKIKLEEKARKKSQENEKELNKRREELTQKQNESKVEIERLRKSADLADQEYQQLKQARAERTAAQEDERQRKKLAEEENRKDRGDKMSLESIHKQAMKYIY